MQQFTELFDHINVGVIRYPAGQLPQFPLFPDQVFADLVQRISDVFEPKEVEILRVALQVIHIALEAVKALEYLCDLSDDLLLLLLAIFEVTQG